MFWRKICLQSKKVIEKSLNWTAFGHKRQRMVQRLIQKSKCRNNFEWTNFGWKWWEKLWKGQELKLKTGLFWTGSMAHPSKAMTGVFILFDQEPFSLTFSEPLSFTRNNIWRLLRSTAVTDLFCPPLEFSTTLSPK